MNKSNGQIIEEFVREVLSGGRGEASDRYIDREFVDHQPWPGHPASLAGFKAGLYEFRQAFPDLQVEVQRLVSEGDTVSALIQMSGSHLGPFMGAPASGKTFQIQALDMVRMKDGKIQEHWGFIDTEALSNQLGLRPA